MKNRHAVVTGGTNGIGREIAIHLINRGWFVSIFDIDTEGHRLAREHDRIAFQEVDVGDEASVESGMEHAIAHRNRLDALVNNAGIADPANAALDELSLESWQRVIGTNLTGTFLCSKYAAPHLRKAGGAIVNIASTRALMSEPNTEAYAASKGGVVALTHAMALSLGPAVRVNCISPGWIDTTANELRPVDHSQHPVGRVGRPSDVAALVEYLISESAGFITGQNLVVDGGMTRRMIYVD